MYFISELRDNSNQLKLVKNYKKLNNFSMMYLKKDIGAARKGTLILRLTASKTYKIVRCF